MKRTIQRIRAYLVLVFSTMIARVAALHERCDRIAADPRLFGRVLAGVILAFFFWAAVSPLDQVSSAQGEVIPSSQIKLVQHLEGGIVSEIHVKEGERVTREQPLISLETVAFSADVGETQARMAGLATEVARLQAEAADQSVLTLPQGVPEHLAREAQTLFADRRANLKAALRAQQEVVTQREMAVREISARVTNTRDATRIIREQVGISEKLLKEEITSKMEHLALQREESGLKSRLEEDQAMIKRLEASIAEARAQATAIQQNYRQQVGGELAKATRELDEIRQRFGKHSDIQRRAILRSPVEGVVKMIHVATRGGVVQPGQTVVEIVPSGDRLVVEAKLPVQEIGYVRIGQTAAVRLASSDAGRFGRLAGKVEHISPDSIVTDQGAFYKVRVETESDRFRQGDDEYRLVPGVRVDVAIVIGRRSVLGYLMAPFTAGMGRALQER